MDVINSTPEWDQINYPDGALYISNGRCAMWQWLRAGLTEITLTEPGKAEHIGYIAQSDKAGDVCRMWMESGQISKNFHMPKKDC